MAADLAWVSLSARVPQDRETVYARAKAGTAKKVVFDDSRPPRWISAHIVYHFEYFIEWAPLEAVEQPLDRTG
jgi:hypothetical protein